MADNKQYVFVYGTLKRNEPNHHWLTSPSNGSAKFVGEAVTTLKYPLVIASDYNIPFLLDKPNVGEYVTGEIYEIDHTMLSNLDILEDYPKWYIREKRPFILQAKIRTEIMAWVYLLQTFKDALLQLPNLTRYTSDGSHGLPYCEPAARDENYDACADVQGKSTDNLENKFGGMDI